MNKWYIILLLIWSVGCGQPETEQESSPYVEQMEAYQDSVRLAFQSGSNGVLTEKDLALSKPILFFPPNEAYRVPATFEAIENGDTFEMRTTTDRLPLYTDHGILRFVLFGDSLSLHVYRNVEHPEYFFCPFKDKTNGTVTYGGGRYLDFSQQDLLDPVIDFNLCYNPYCAYNPDYSCPIPPRENHLPIAIEAGVKKFK